MTRSAQNSIATIDDFINAVGSVKTASDGVTPLSEPGSIGGETTHPVKKVDDRLQKAKEGERSAENSKDVKNDQGPPSVENAAQASTKNAAASIFNVVNRFAKKAEGAVSTPGSAEDDHISTTTKVAPTGEDPANETNSAKAGKEDKRQGGVGGTKHPASTENNSLDGHKYAADTPLEKLAADMQTLGNSLLTAVHHVYQNNGVATQQKTASAPVQPQQQVDADLAYLAGHELAGLVNGTFDKRAADQLVHQTLTQVIKQASDDADMFIAYAYNFIKASEDGMPPPGGEPPMPPPGGGGAPPMPGGGGDDEAMLAALGGGAGGGEPPMPGGEGGGDAEAQHLAQILQELGVSPEELEQALAAEGGGGGPPDMGGPPPGAGGPPPGAGGPPPGMETQANAGGGKRNAESIKQAEIKNYLTEIVSRSRGRR